LATVIIDEFLNFFNIFCCFAGVLSTLTFFIFSCH
jgi:hypothetical protein